MAEATAERPERAGWQLGDGAAGSDGSQSRADAALCAGADEHALWHALGRWRREARDELEGLRKYQWYREANPEGPKKYELKLPPLGDSWEQLKEWMRAMKARVAESA